MFSGKTSSRWLGFGLALSLAANGVAWVRLAQRPREPLVPPPSAVVEMPPPAPRPTLAALSPEQREKLGGATSATIGAEMRALGFPERLIGAMEKALRLSEIGHELTTLASFPSGTPPWKNIRSLRRADAGARSLREHELQAEFTRLAGSFRGEEALIGEANRDLRLLANLVAPEKRAKLALLLRDYEEMREAIETEAGLVSLPSDARRLELLDLERERDVAALFSPEERAQVEKYLSREAEIVGGFFGHLIDTEQEFDAVLAEEKDWQRRLTKFSNKDVTVEPLASEHAQHVARVKEILGPERIDAAYVREDPEAARLEAIRVRLSLAPELVSEVAKVRGSVETESQAIAQNESFSAEQKREALKRLAAKTEALLTDLLGTDGAKGYLDGARWHRGLGRGYAFKYDQSNELKVTPVAPADPRIRR